MLRAQRAAYIATAWALDIAALTLAFLVAWTLRDSLGIILIRVGEMLGYPVRTMVRTGESQYPVLLSPNPLINIQNHLWILYLSLPAWLFFLNVQKGYDASSRRSPRQEFAICAYSGMLAVVALMVFVVLSKKDISRLLLMGVLLLGVSFLWLERTVVLPLAQRRGRQPVRNLLVIGPYEAARRFAGVLRTPAYRWSRLLGFIWDDAGAANAEAIEGERRRPLPHLGLLRDLTLILDRDVVDEVVIVRPGGDIASSLGAEPILWSDILDICLQRGRTVSLVDDLSPPVGAKVEATMMGTLPTLVLHNTPQNTLTLSIKNVMDRVVAFAALVMLAPILGVIALLIKLHDRGPILFKQKRVGLNGRLFSFYKFRSMAVNAEAILERMKREDPERYAAINIMQEPFFKAKEGNDPRITPIGKFIRKYSLDELPQFWNVLRGDMSLVGPRPPLPKEVEELAPWQKRKLSVKGGLTCIWQATGRNTITDADEWMRLDLEYIDNWSLWLDVKLLFQTAVSLVKSKGAS